MNLTRGRVLKASVGFVLGLSAGHLAFLGYSGLHSSLLATHDLCGSGQMPVGAVEIMLTRTNPVGRYPTPDYTVTIDGFGRVLLECREQDRVFTSVRYEIGAERAYHLALLLYRAGYFGLDDRDDGRPSVTGSTQEGFRTMTALTRLRIGEREKQVYHVGWDGFEVAAMEELIDVYAETEAHFPGRVADPCTRGAS